MSTQMQMSAPSHITPGFEVFPSVVNRTEVVRIGEAFEGDAIVRSRAGARHLMQHPAVDGIARDRRLVSIASRFLGTSAIPFRATLFDKSPDNNWLVVWHQDTALPLRERRAVSGWGPWSVKAGITYAHAPASALSRVVALRLHIDDSRSDNGPLRVLPGTDTLGVLSDAEVAYVASDVHAVDCVAPAGGIVAMRPLLIHASSKAEIDRRRRVLHIEYADSLHIAAGLELAIA